MNTRLQVEHPVTELVTGCDLVRLQLLVAEGQALPPEVHAALSRGPVGHAVEARIYAEDPAADWLPSTGTVHRFEIPAASPVSASSADGSPAEDGTSLRVDSGVESGSTVSPHYDPMLAKVITHGPTRAEAVAALARVLSTSAIHGVTTNRDLLVRTLRHPAFAAGDIDTGFLERHDLSKLSAPLADAQAVERHAVAAALTGRAHRRAQATVQPAMPSGWRNNPSQLEQTTFDVQDHSITVGYRFDRAGSHVELVEIDGGDQLMVVGRLDADSVVLTVDDVTRRYRVARAAHTTFVDGPDGSTVLVEQERFPIPGSQVPAGSAVAPMPGGVARVNVAVGDHVQAGQDLVVLEAMKMEHTVHAAIEGTVAEVMVTPGTQVESGQVLVVLEETAGPGEQTDDR
jgi:acetyl/propionyl-CoA carboxylase alpha subunit